MKRGWRDCFFVVMVLVVFFCNVGRAMAGNISTVAPLTKEDRIMVLAPHPDDEVIGAGGIIQEAVAVGASVKVVMLTNGENNELSFIVYKKRPVFRPKELLSMGELRVSESRQALETLGLSSKDIVVLGYPDYGTMDVFTKYWGVVKSPFRSMLAHQRYVPYQNARTPGAPFVGESVLSDLKDVIRDFRPTRIMVSHPADTNRDHRALYLFTRVALWDLQKEIQMPKVCPYIIHVVGWPKPRGLHPDMLLEVPPELTQSDIDWETFVLKEEQRTLKIQAVWKYVSQVKYAPKYLISFARANELFGDYPPVILARQMASEPAWQYVGTGPDQISALAYAVRGNDLMVKLILKNPIDKELGVSIFLMGYRENIPFDAMPKLNLIIGIDGMHVKDQRKNVHSKDIRFVQHDKEMTFSIPLSELGNPERLLSSAKTSMYDLTLDETAWRVLLIN